MRTNWSGVGFENDIFLGPDISSCNNDKLLEVATEELTVNRVEVHKLT
jgi:hypothetical protein